MPSNPYFQFFAGMGNSAADIATDASYVAKQVRLLKCGNTLTI